MKFKKVVSGLVCLVVLFSSSIAVFAAAPVAAVLAVVSIAYASSIWMSATKRSYYCSRYNGIWKTGIRYVIV
ncbi:hypothetical protein G9F73_005950 [Clostridium estertheticum]|uniref:hypothetical protein n=1 Tax=Clostridium estertheticum TaxID=238834 RepID=UPI0013EEBD42|nr:hypothetical protein [Clostridium estertheticum]MBZ9607365.1 hypothetical protein [Clostridium estertheticum]